MRAVTASQFGKSPAVTEIMTPSAGPGQVLIRLVAAGVNPMIGASGTYAEYVAVTAEAPLARIPEGVDLVVATSRLRCTFALSPVHPQPAHDRRTALEELPITVRLPRHRAQQARPATRWTNRVTLRFDLGGRGVAPGLDWSDDHSVRHDFLLCGSAGLLFARADPLQNVRAAVVTSASRRGRTSARRHGPRQR